MSSSSYVFCCVVRVTRMLSAMHFQPAFISVDDCVVRVMDFPKSMRRGPRLFAARGSDGGAGEEAARRAHGDGTTRIGAKADDGRDARQRVVANRYRAPRNR
ncbi:hypothetical protein [Burkholderia multivorans]|uniref:hypothetical protein n=2 Tax=Burkholderia multivorans TaxID=87883 RepID=UPI00112466D8|nr:hypothetical protein [Burkholderia multivorans]HEF5151637.1 hypothetical protein [Burkholderia multivorans]HEF5157103.1 hypothetical protein [Burkholderia multivorans]